MQQTAEYFDKNGYVVLQNALSKDQCDNLVSYMFKLHNEGKLTKDEQCPLSDAIYGDDVFDDILLKFCEPISKAVSKQLIPTYTYARIYRPGEILHKHKDRPACEISATLTLGYDAKQVWPIFFDENKEVMVNLEPGELAVYKGCEILHWRTAFKGNWHVQVFLHYVDANGPYKDQAKDGRENYGTQKSTDSPNIKIHKPVTINQQQDLVYSKPIPNAIVIPPVDQFFPGYMVIDKDNLPNLRFTLEECDKILELTKFSYPTSASVGGTLENSKITKSIRSAKIFDVPYSNEYHWLFEKITAIVSLANTYHFKYDITGIIHGLQLINYSSEDEIKGHYDWHIDAGSGAPSTRKISFTAQMSSFNDYEGCELIINNHGEEIIGTKERGSVHLFPSYLQHKVTPITKGERYALVIWIHGSNRFR